MEKKEVYTKLSHHDHILQKGDMYLGSTAKQTEPMWIMTEDNSAKIVLETVEYVPAFYKIFDEIIVNAADNKIRSPDTDVIKVVITEDEITVTNNGKGLPIEIHEKEKIYVPELIFGNLLTSSHYEETEKRITGGLHGYGAKLVNIYSTEFTVETCDGEKKYTQTWKDNMKVMGKPKIRSISKKTSYTTVSFKPDLKRFGLDTIDNVHRRLFSKRVYDLTATVTGVKVYLNGQRLKIGGFKDYLSLYGTDAFVYERFGDRWEVAVGPSNDGFRQISFVNSVCTYKGGTHVAHVVDQIVGGLVAFVRKKVKDAVVKPAQIKNHLCIFINCLIEDATYDSQSKYNLVSKPTSFGSKCDISEGFIKKIVGKLDVMNQIIEELRAKEEKMLAKTDGSKKSKIHGIAKLNDANMAGTKKSAQCTLFLVEGDSALSFALTGITVLGRDYYGAFPLRGKLLNVRDSSPTEILSNIELNQLKTILGLKNEKIYTSVDELRYGAICICTDSDVDGQHIKGLLLNWLDHFWPSLMLIDGFVKDFITPTVKCTRRGRQEVFYTTHQYDTWKQSHGGGAGWAIKYYKGLGTSKPTEIKEYFKQVDNHFKHFLPATAQDRESLDLVFNKKRANDRKDWLTHVYNPDVYLDTSNRFFAIKEFIDKSFIQFSMYDNIRNIPSCIDGLKPGQRKIMYTVFERNIVSDMKVAQLASAVAEKTEYRHGEQSLADTIVSMAQTFVGANNINLLEPEGGFGSRMRGGKDASSARYVYTKMSPVTRLLFHPADDPILDYNSEDGVRIEPRYYVPIIPLVLVNGAEGIGTGYSTTVLPHDPIVIIDYLLKKLEQPDTLYTAPPHYAGFLGSVVQDGTGWKFTGIATRKDDQLTITELPVQTWTQNYKEHLEKLIVSGVVKEYKEYHTDINVKFVVKLQTGLADEDVGRVFKLTCGKHETNMVLFNRDLKLAKFPAVNDIMKEFVPVRMETYRKRKAHVLDQLQTDLTVIENKVRFIESVVDNKLVIQKRAKMDIVDEMKAADYVAFKDGYDYLLNMSMITMSKEKIDELEKERKTKKQKYDEMEKLSCSDLWKEDLMVLRKYLIGATKKK